MFLSTISYVILLATVSGLIIRSDIDSIDGKRCTKSKPVAAVQFPVKTIQCVSIEKINEQVADIKLVEVNVMKWIHLGFHGKRFILNGNKWIPSDFYIHKRRGYGEIKPMTGRLRMVMGRGKAFLFRTKGKDPSSTKKRTTTPRFVPQPTSTTT